MVERKQIATAVGPNVHAPAVSPRDAVRKAKTREARRILEDSAPTAAAYLALVVSGEAPAKRERVDAAKTVLDRCGIVPPEREKGAEDKDLTEMSGPELLAVLQAAESELAARAKPVSVAVEAPADAQANDIFG